MSEFGHKKTILKISKCPHLRCSWKCFFKLCVLCIILNLLLVNIYLSFLYPLVYPENIDCSKYRKNRKQDDVEREDFESNTKLAVNDSNLPNWVAVARHSYVYSAYHCKCPPQFTSSECIQFIGISLDTTESHPKQGESTTYISSLKCGFRKQSAIYREGFAFVELLPESHFLPYTAAFFYCDLKVSESEIFPEFATIYDEKPRKWFPVEKTSFNEDFRPPSLSLCVRPLYGHFPKLFILQFLSYYLSKGVNQFVFYHHNVSWSTLKFLNHVALNGINMTLLPWNVPLGKSEVHEYGQIVFTQDCLARSRYKYSHTLLVDLDEFLVPKEHTTLIQLVTSLDTSHSPAGSFVFRNVFFCDEFQNRLNISLPAVHHDQRQRTPWAYGYRSKYIAQPHRVRYGGVHKVWGFENGYHEVNAPSSVALLHHYRACCGMQQTWLMHLFSFNVLHDGTVTDKSLALDGKLFNDTLTHLILSLT